MPIAFVATGGSSGSKFESVQPIPPNTPAESIANYIEHAYDPIEPPADGDPGIPEINWNAQSQANKSRRCRGRRRRD